MNGRRRFLQIVVAGIVSFFAIIWNKLTLNHLESNSPKSRIFSFNKNKKVEFVDDYIIVTQDKHPVVFSAHCSHLGCRIDKMNGDRLVCPCHGSEYDLTGKVLKGPAYRNLTVIDSVLSDDETKIVIGG